MSRARVRRLVASVLKELGHRETEISISFVEDEEIRGLNRDHLGRDRATNVLSFSMREGEWSEVNANLLGDVVVSVDRALARSKRVGTDPTDEIAYLLIHGILHLTGYDHEGGADGRRMRKLQEDLFTRHKGSLRVR